MKIINANWDEAVIGEKVYEIIFSPNDDYNSYINSGIEDKDYTYLVAKVPSYLTGLIHKLEGSGYRYLENQFNIRVETNQIHNLKRTLGKKALNLELQKLESQDQLNIIFEEINNGLFLNDRFSVDPEFGTDFSSKRYTNWLKNIFSTDHQNVFYIKSDSSIIGFLSIDCTRNHTYKALIAGLFEKYRNLGYSTGLIYLYLKHALQNRAKGIETSFSGNNTRMINLFSRVIEYKIVNNYSVFRKNKKLI